MGKKSIGNRREAYALHTTTRAREQEERAAGGGSPCRVLTPQNDRKFSGRVVFFSHTNQPAVLLHEPATISTGQPNRPTAVAIIYLCRHIYICT